MSIFLFSHENTELVRGIPQHFDLHLYWGGNSHLAHVSPRRYATSVCEILSGVWNPWNSHNMGIGGFFAGCFGLNGQTNLRGLRLRWCDSRFGCWMWVIGIRVVQNAGSMGLIWMGNKILIIMIIFFISSVYEYMKWIAIEYFFCYHFFKKVISFKRHSSSNDLISIIIA